ncbi:MAG: DUF3750 domain-containing protein [Granulosicoccus sp.]|nr:DUF3750 domain-containing protein [Granulosicoccus sp.]
MKRLHRYLGRILLIILALFFMPVGCMVAAHYSADNRGGRSGDHHESTQQAPAAQPGEAVIQVYSARAARWRGAFGVHTWIATRRTDEVRYTRLEVIGYRVYWGGNAVQIRTGEPDAKWFGNHPTLLRDLRGGERVNVLIDHLRTAATDYPYNSTYHVWPGPNSNTFTAYLGRRVPELRLELPSNAIGKDYLPGGSMLSRTPSGTGLQLSLGGYGGVMAGWEEGLEVNFLGLSAGIDLWPLALKLPGVGRLGFSDLRRMHLHEP